MKFGQLIEYDKTNFFFLKNHAENERLVPGLFLLLKKAFYEVKAIGL